MADIKNQLLKLQDTSDERLRTASDRLQNAKSARDEKLLALQQAEQIVAQFDGIVIGLSTNVGDIVQFGSPVARIRKDKRTAEIIASSFFPAGAAKKLEKGMSVQVAPDNVEVDKYGYAIGKVISVDSFPATLEEIQDLFQNSNLASNLLDSGPVIQVAVDLQEDPSTPSQLQWTSSRGPDFKITEGTLCTIAAITRKDRPVDLVIPVIKKKILGIGEDN